MSEQRKSAKISVLLEQDEFDRFELYCRGKGFKKSTLVARLIRDFLDEERFRIQRNLPFVEKGTSRSQ